MFYKKPYFFIFCLVIETCFAQDAVFHVRQKIQETIANNKEQQSFAKAIVAGNKTVLDSIDFNLYDGDYLERIKSTRNWDGKCLSDLFEAREDFSHRQTYAIRSE